MGADGRPNPAEWAQIVARTRPTSTDYVPVGTSASPRRLPAKDPQAVGQAEAEMERVRTRNETLGAQARRAAAPDGAGKEGRR